MKNNNIETLIYKIKYNVKESSNQNDKFTEYHTRLDCTLNYNNITYNFDFQCNTENTEPTKEIVLGCVLSDSRCYLDAKVNDNDIDNLEEFKALFGYENIKELLQAYEGCKNAYNHINKMFTKEEQEQLFDYLEEKGLI